MSFCLYNILICSYKNRFSFSINRISNQGSYFQKDQNMYKKTPRDKIVTKPMLRPILAYLFCLRFATFSICIRSSLSFSSSTLSVIPQIQFNAFPVQCMSERNRINENILWTGKCQSQLCPDSFTTQVHKEHVSGPKMDLAITCNSQNSDQKLPAIVFQIYTFLYTSKVHLT